MPIRALFLLQFFDASVYSQHEIALLNGKLFVNNQPIPHITNITALESAINTKSKYSLYYQYLPIRIKYHTKYYAVIFNDAALRFKLSSPEIQIEEILCSFHIEPLFDLPKRLQKNPIQTTREV